MSYASEQIVRALVEARERKGLSQRELSALSGVQRHQISKIENGAVDLRLSSLVSLARALDLELTLVPQTALPAVKGILQTAQRREGPQDQVTKNTVAEITRVQNAFRGVGGMEEMLAELSQLRRQAGVPGIRLTKNDQQRIRGVLRKLITHLERQGTADELEQMTRVLRDIRNQLAHAAGAMTFHDTGRPAYSLEQDDDHG